MQSSVLHRGASELFFSPVQQKSSLILMRKATKPPRKRALWKCWKCFYFVSEGISTAGQSWNSCRLRGQWWHNASTQRSGYFQLQGSRNPWCLAWSSTLQWGKRGGGDFKMIDSIISQGQLRRIRGWGKVVIFSWGKLHISTAVLQFCDESQQGGIPPGPSLLHAAGASRVIHRDGTLRPHACSHSPVTLLTPEDVPPAYWCGLKGLRCKPPGAQVPTISMHQTGALGQTQHITRCREASSGPE